MVFERFKRHPAGDAEDSFARSKPPVKRPTGEAQLAHYNQIVAPQLGAYENLCREIQAAISQGTADASPERIRAALSTPPDPMLKTYTDNDRNLLSVECMNYGIDPSTGEPDRDKQHTIVTLLKQGYQEPQILGAVGLAAHPTFPAVLMRDDQFRLAIEAAQQRT